jgi:hypothetical protein
MPPWVRIAFERAQLKPFAEWFDPLTVMRTLA